MDIASKQIALIRIATASEINHLSTAIDAGTTRNFVYEDREGFGPLRVSFDGLSRDGHVGHSFQV